MTDLPVIFRIDREGVTAVFPTLPADYVGLRVTIYVHVGQHGGASWGWYHDRRHRLAKPEEYADLLTELRGIYGRSHCPGDPAFNLVPVRRITQEHRKAFDAEVRRLNERILN